jgi:dethiobiotin synthetase
MPPIFFITGTGTGVGKTVLTALLASHLRQRGISVAVLKPVASGSRADARMLYTALAGALTLDEINPWHFRAPLAPLLAARRERKSVTKAAVLGHIRRMQQRFAVVLVEGAGGLLSPLGEDFNSRDLIAALRAAPVIVGPNRIGVLNQMLLTLGALPRAAAARARVVLMSPPRPDAATKTNGALLAEFFDQERIFELPWLGRRWRTDWALADARVQRTLQKLTKVRPG